MLRHDAIGVTLEVVELRIVQEQEWVRLEQLLSVALAHLLFNVPLAVWILEGFVSGVPKEIDETAFLDGYSFPKFFVKILMPLIASGIGVAAFFCFMFSWVELLLARTLTSVNAKPIVATMTRTVSASGMDWATLAAAGVLFLSSAVVIIPAGHVGVQVLFGKVKPEPLTEGISFINPFANVQEMSVRTETYTMSATLSERSSLSA